MMEPVWAERSRIGEMVGRERELAALHRLISRQPPTSSAVVLAGDAGVGKTRLVRELLHGLADDGWRVLVGHCLDFGDTAMPYLPFTEILQRLSQSEPALADDLAASHPALAELLRSHLGSGGPADGLGRAEIFSSIHALFEDLADRGPLVVVCEDAHWADPSSRDLLSFLLARGFDGPVALLISYRSDDLHRRHPLRRAVAEWSRTAGVERLQLAPLASAEVRRMVASMTGAADGAYAEDIERIVDRSEGNPFYVEELVGAFLSGGWQLPEDLANLLLVRLDRLDDDARQLVREAAVAGQRVPHDLLVAVSGLSGEAFDAALRSATDQHVLVRIGERDYAFRHALLGEAVYDDLLPGERLRLHTAYAHAIRERLGRSSPAALARHAQASHDLPTALLASIDAGRQAMVVGGPDEAARHFQTALELYPQVARIAGDDLPDLAGLAAEAGEAIAMSGHVDRALALVTAQLAELPDDASPESRARLLLAIAETALMTESKVDLLTTTTEALALAEDNPRLRARILAAHAWGHIVVDDLPAARDAVEEAIELATTLDMPRLAGEARTTLSRLTQFEQYGAVSRLELTRAVDDARRRGDVQGQIVALFRLGHVHYEYAELDAARTAWARALELGRSAGRPWSPFVVDARLRIAVLDYVRGAWDEALAIADTTAENPPATSRAMLAAVDLAVRAGRGEVDALGRLGAVRERWTRDGIIAVLSAGPAIELHALRDGPGAALKEYDRAVDVLAALWEEHFQARVRLAALTLGCLAEAAGSVPSGERGDALDRADRLRDDAEAVRVDLEKRDRPFGEEGRAWLARASAEQLHLRWRLGERVDHDELVAAWHDTVAAFDAFGEVYEAARSRARLAEALRAGGDPTAAAVAVAAAREVALRLGAVPLLASLDRLAPATRGAVALTPREQEILALVATGRSNGEIARQLFISVKTVSVHVSNVLAKLGASSRTEAVVIAQREALLPSTGPAAEVPAH
jgi:DNA-binding CsgD family transcriptional regulator/tetratricopeptide (TPR) repeat protein